MGEFLTAPNIIEQSNFQGGWQPGAVEEQSGPSEQQSFLEDVLNLLPDESSSALQLRKGFVRLRDVLVATPTQGRHVKALAAVHVQAQGDSAPGTQHFLIVATTNGLDEANNVRIFSVDLTSEALTTARIDTAGVTWDNPNSDFWMVPINNVLYGGSRGNPMFSWDGTTWDATAGTGSWKAVVDDVNDNVTPATEFGRDYAWKGTEKATFSGATYSPNRSIRYENWTDDDDQHYAKGDRVSHSAVWATTSQYYKSFRCIKAHAASLATTEPGVGATWKTYWKKVVLGLPLNADNETREGWDFVIQPSETKVGTYWADRLWLRFDGYGADRLQFSAPVKPEHDKDIPATLFDPTDFAPGNDIKGAGGGWLAFNEGRRSAPIQAIRPFGNSLLVFTRNVTFALTGWSEESFDIRVLRRGVGCLGVNATTELDGICYFLDSDGLYMTDGTDVQETPGNAAVRQHIRSRIRDMDFVRNDGQTPTLFRQGRLIGIALPTPNDYETLFYDTERQAFWKTDLPVSHTLRTQMAFEPEQLIFSTAADYGGVLVYRYGGSTDDGGLDYETEEPIRWYMRTNWWPFGLLRTQRRIRRTWAVVKGLGQYTLSVFTDWDHDVPKNVLATQVDTEYSTHVEGRVVPDCHSIQFQLEGESSDPVTIHGLAVDTEPRRIRYHS
jgi:hypothetical protein